MWMSWRHSRRVITLENLNPCKLCDTFISLSLSLSIQESPTCVSLWCNFCLLNIYTRWKYIANIAWTSKSCFLCECDSCVSHNNIYQEERGKRRKKRRKEKSDKEKRKISICINIGQRFWKENRNLIFHTSHHTWSLELGEPTNWIPICEGGEDMTEM